MKKDGDGDASGDKNEQCNEKLYDAWDRYMRILLQKRSAHGACSEAGEHCEPAIGDWQWPFVNE